MNAQLLTTPNMFMRQIILAMLLGMLLASRVADADPNRSNEAERASSRSRVWGILEINPNPFLSIVYKDTFRVSVYKNEVPDPTLALYFYSPALILDPASASSTYNIFTKRFELTFSVIMWDADFEEFVRSKVSQKTGQSVPRSSIRTLPIEEIRVEGLSHSEEIEILNKWTSYANQPASFVFRLNCLTNETCHHVVEIMQQNPSSFVSEMVVYYSLQTQRSSRRFIQVKAPHVQNSIMFTTLAQRFPEKDVVYMKPDDLQKFTQEIANIVISTEVVDDEFVSQDQSHALTALLQSILRTQTVSTSSFTDQMWDSVFWQAENARPDRVTQALNDAYNNSDQTFKSAIRLSHETVNTNSGKMSVGKKLLGGSASDNKNLSPNATASEVDEKISLLLNEAKGTSQWDGEKFIPKPLELSLINLSGLRGNAVIASTQVRVTKSTAELSSRINVLPGLTAGGVSLISVKSNATATNAEKTKKPQEYNDLWNAVNELRASITTQGNTVNDLILNTASQYDWLSSSFSELENKCLNKTITVDQIIFGDGRWTIQVEKNVLVFRDRRTAGDYRYAMYSGRKKDL